MLFLTLEEENAFHLSCRMGLKWIPWLTGASTAPFQFFLSIPQFNMCSQNMAVMLLEVRHVRIQKEFIRDYLLITLDNTTMQLPLTQKTAQPDLGWSKSLSNKHKFSTP